MPDLVQRLPLTHLWTSRAEDRATQGCDLSADPGPEMGWAGDFRPFAPISGLHAINPGGTGGVSEMSWFTHEMKGAHTGNDSFTG
jgi:hypothetical protein